MEVNNEAIAELVTYADKPILVRCEELGLTFELKSLPKDAAHGDFTETLVLHRIEEELQLPSTPPLNQETDLPPPPTIEQIEMEEEQRRIRRRRRIRKEEFTVGRNGKIYKKIKYVKKYPY